MAQDGALNKLTEDIEKPTPTKNKQDSALIPKSNFKKPVNQAKYNTKRQYTVKEEIHSMLDILRAVPPPPKLKLTILNKINNY